MLPVNILVSIKGRKAACAYVILNRGKSVPPIQLMSREWLKIEYPATPSQAFREILHKRESL
jgi:hypothetical protein